MIPIYTQSQIGILSTGKNYLLPESVIHADLSDEEIVDKVYQWFSDTSLFSAYYKSIERTAHNTILVHFSYESYEDYYPFVVTIRFIRFRRVADYAKQRAIPDRCPILQLGWEYSDGGCLFEELLDIRVKPELIAKKELTSYYDR